MSNQNQAINASLSSAQAITILVPQNPQYQEVAAGLSLFLALKSRGQNVEIACPSEMTVAVNHLVGVDKIITKIPGQNLVISFDYVRDAIEKVSYNVNNGKFNLVVQPKTGHKPLSAQNVTYSLTGPAADLVILIGTSSIKDFQKLLPEIDFKKTQSLSLIPGNGHSLIAETHELIRASNLPLDTDSAGNLLKGLTAETNQFIKASAVDFEIAADLVKAGGTIQTTIKSPFVPIKSDMTEFKPADSDKPDWTGPKIYRSGEIG